MKLGITLIKGCSDLMSIQMIDYANLKKSTRVAFRPIYASTLKKACDLCSACTHSLICAAKAFETDSLTVKRQGCINMYTSALSLVCPFHLSSACLLCCSFPLMIKNWTLQAIVSWFFLCTTSLPSHPQFPTYQNAFCFSSPDSDLVAKQTIQPAFCRPDFV